MKKPNCKTCVEKAGRKWDSTCDNDLAEGLCPAVRGIESYVCKKTGKRIKPSGVVHTI